MSNFDRNEEIKKEAEELKKEIEEKENKLMELRDTCSHSDYKVKDINGIGASKLRKICVFCGHIMGFPTGKDLKDNGYN